MDENIARAVKLEKKAKKLGRWGLFSSKHKAQLLDQAAKSYKLAKSWDKARETYINLADHHLKTKTQHKAAATAYVEAAHCYDITSVDHEAIIGIKIVANILHDLGTLNPTTTCFFEKATQLYKEFAQLLEYAAASYKLAREWFKAKRMYIELAAHHLKIKTEDEAAVIAYFEAAHCFDITSDDDAISCLKEGVDYLLDIGINSPAATCYKTAILYKEIAERYESKNDIEKAIKFFEKASKLFQMDAPTSVNQCSEKAAQLAAEIEQYTRAIEMYENIANYLQNHCQLLDHKIKKHIFNAGICRLCRGDDAIEMAKRYADMYPTFSHTWQCECLENIAVSFDNCDLTKFLDAVKKLDKMTPLDSWATKLLSRVEEQLKASMSRRTRRPIKALDSIIATGSDGGEQNKMPAGLETSQTTIKGLVTMTEECTFSTYTKAPVVELDAAKFSDAARALEVVDSWRTKLLTRAAESVKTRWSANKVADLTSASFNSTAFSDGGKQREMCTGLPRSQTVMHRSPPTGSKLTRSSSRIGMSVAPVNGILQKGLASLKRSLSMAKQ